MVVLEANDNIWIAGYSSIKMSVSSVDQVQSGTSWAKHNKSIPRYNQHNNSGSSATTNSKVETQPIVLRATRQSNEPVTAILNVVTLPQSEQKIVGHEDAGSPFEFVLIFVGAVILVVVAGFAVYSRKENPIIKY